jgi:cytidine deaminase
MTLTSAGKKKLIALAVHIRTNAYAPYSNYKVGAALLGKSGKIFTGVNVENAAYPSGICAERSAIFSGVTAGETRFDAIVVATENGGFPCGACRQVMAEFGLDLHVIMVNHKGAITQESTLRELLPSAFTPDVLMHVKS